MATLSVGRNQQFTTIQAALAAARDEDTVTVQAGSYVNDILTIRAKVNLVAVGGQVTLSSTQPLASGKALVTVATDAVIDGFVVRGANAPDGSAAGILVTGGAATIRNSLVTGNQTGLLAQGSATTVLIQGSEFAANGNNDGLTGNIATGAIQSLTIQSSYVHDVAGGNEIKSLARTTAVVGSRIEDVGGNGLSLLNLPNGGAVSVHDTVLEKGARSQSAPAIRFGGGTLQSGSSLSVSGNTIVTDKPGALLLQNTTPVIANVSGNQLYGFTAGPISSGQAVLSGNVTALARPAISTAALVVPGVSSAVDYGRAGAVVTDGSVLSVGAQATFATLGAALAVAHDGTTIDVAAGSYAIAPTTIGTKVVIEGVGGLASFTQAPSAPTGAALLTTTTDVTLRNIEVSGVAAPGGVEAAILDQAGSLTVVNSAIHDNQAGIVATGSAGTVGIYDSEVARNGTPDGQGGNVAVSAIGTLVLQNDFIHDALAGAEVTSRAANTVIADTRISQVNGNGTADVALPAGGAVTITNSVIEKGANSQVAPLIQVGPATPATAPATAPGTPATVAIVSTTLISDLAAAPTTFIAAAAATGPVSVTGSSFIGGAAGSTQVQSGGATASVTAAVVKTGVAVNPASPVQATSAATTAATPVPIATATAATTPAVTTPAAATSVMAAPTVAGLVAAPVTAAGEHGVLVLDISEDAYRGHAQFTVTVDGVQVGGTMTAGASHAAGQSQAFTIAGTFAPGPHSVGVKFLNDLQGSGTGAERNLYVDAMTFNGVDAGQSSALKANGTALLSTGPVVRATPIAVNLSEDAWHGDAACFIAIDGKVQNGLQVVTASHGAGKTTAMNFLLDLAPGGHTVGVTYLNDANGGAAGGDRNLYVDSVDVAGTHYAGAAAPLLKNGTSTFAFTVAPPPAANANLFLTAGLSQPAAMLLPVHG